MNSSLKAQLVPNEKNNADNLDVSEAASKPKETIKVLKIITDQVALGHSEDRKPYAYLSDGMVVPLYSTEIKSLITYLYYQEYETTLSLGALNEALDTAGSMAMQEGNEWQLWVRSARAVEQLEIDQVGDGDHRIRIQPDQVEVIPSNEGDFLFIRSPDARPLPMPKLCSDSKAALDKLDLLKNYINLEDPDNILIVWAWVAYSLFGLRGFPILALVGSPGSGKSEIARIIRQLIDPNTLPLGSIAASDREAFIEARSIRLLSFDNIQPIRKVDISDRLAKIATGGGIRPRQLYSDNATNAMFVCNPIITTSIEVPARRPDLVDRMLTINLRRVPEEQRIPASLLEERFEGDAPEILGGICVLISKAMVELRLLDPTAIQLPRLADFGLFGIAVERVLGLPDGRFIELYQKSIKVSSQGVVEEEPLLQAIIALMESSGENHLHLTPKELCLKLALQDIRNRKEFNPKSVGRKIRLLTEDLDRQGITCTFGRDKDRYIELTKRTL